MILGSKLGERYSESIEMLEGRVLIRRVREDYICTIFEERELKRYSESGYD